MMQLMPHGMPSTAMVYRSCIGLSSAACLLMPASPHAPWSQAAVHPSNFTRIWAQAMHALAAVQPALCLLPYSNLHSGNGSLSTSLSTSGGAEQNDYCTFPHGSLQQPAQPYNRPACATGSTRPGVRLQPSNVQQLMLGRPQFLLTSCTVQHQRASAWGSTSARTYVGMGATHYSTAAQTAAATTTLAGSSSPAEQAYQEEHTAGSVTPSSQLSAERVHASWNLSKVIAALETLPESEAFLYRFASKLRARHVAQLIARLPSLDMRVENARQRVNTLLRLTTQSLQQYTHQLQGRQLAACIWACAKLGYSPHGAVSSLAQALVTGAPTPLSTCRGPDLSNLAWALATLQAMYGSSMQSPEPTPPISMPQLEASSQPTHDMTVADGSRRETQQEGVYTKPADLLWPPLVSAALTHCHTMTGVEISQLAWAMAASGLYHQGLFNALAERAILLCPKASPQEPGSQMSHLHSSDALARMSFRERRLWYKQQHAAEQAAQQAARAASIALVTSGRTVPAVHAGSSDALVPSEDVAIRPAAVRTKVLAAKPATDLVWAFTSVRHRHPRLFAALAQAVLHDQLSLQTEDVSTLLWGYASWGFYDSNLLDVLVSRAARSIYSLSPEQLSRVMWALATLHHHDELLWKRVAKALANYSMQHTTLTPQLAANLLWALGVMPPTEHNRFTDNAVSHLIQPLQLPGAAKQLSTQQLLRTFWAVASLEPTWGSNTAALADLLITLCDVLRSRAPAEVPVEALAPIHHAGLALGMSTALMRHLAPAVATHVNSQYTGQWNSEGDGKVRMPMCQVNQASEASTPRGMPAERGMPSDLSEAAVAASTSSAEAGGDLEGAESPATSSTNAAVQDENDIIDISYVQPLPGLTPQKLAPSTSVLAVLAPAFAEAAYQAALLVAQRGSSQEHASGEVTPTSQQQVASSSVQLSSSASGRGVSSHSSTQERSIITGCVHDIAPHPVWLTEVQQALHDIGLHGEEQVLAVHGTVSVDLAVLAKSAKVAFCFHGPKQYSCSTPHILTGRPQLFRRLLQADGWRVISIPWYEWSLMYTEEEQYSHLCNLLEAQQVHVGVDSWHCLRLQFFGHLTEASYHCSLIAFC